MTLTKHERHARLVKIVRRTYQADNLGSRLFPNNSGVAWQGEFVQGAGKVELLHPRPLYYGIPEPERKKDAPRKSGGTDLLGETEKTLAYFNKGWQTKNYPVLTGIECKSGKGKLKKNQKIFRDWMKKINAIWYKAVECPICWDKWIPIYKSNKIVEWEIGYCEACNSKGFTLEDD